MKRFGLISACVVLLAVLGVWPWQEVRGGLRRQNPVERGRYLVNAMACGDCHTPARMTPSGPVPDEARVLAGHPCEFEVPDVPGSLDARWAMIVSSTHTAFAGPWGVSYAANLTPHPTGIGMWTEEMFVDALRYGKRMGVGREILPPMPWPAYANLSDEDLAAVFAYLRSLPPVQNAVPANRPPAAAVTMAIDPGPTTSRTGH